MLSFRAVLSALAIAATCATSASAENRSVRFQNFSRGVVYGIYASPVSSLSTGHDLLGDRVLEPDEYLDVIFQDVSECIYDVRFITEGGDITDKLNICVFTEYNISN